MIDELRIKRGEVMGNPNYKRAVSSFHFQGAGIKEAVLLKPRDQHHSAETEPQKAQDEAGARKNQELLEMP